jgi:hypothetical protein
MNRIGLKSLFFLVIGAAFLAGCASTRPQVADEWDGLVRQPNTRLRALFLKPDAELAGYLNIKVDPVQVSFARNWEANRGGRSSLRRLDAADIQAIQTGVADLVNELFTAELGRGGYQIVQEAGAETLRVTASVVDLYIAAPDNMSAGRGRTYTANSGRMTLLLEVRDSITGELLARAVDARSGRGSGTWSVTNRVTNTADARRAINIWAAALRAALDELNGKTTPAG